MKYSYSEMILLIFFITIGIVAFSTSFFIIFLILKNWKVTTLKKKLIQAYSAFLILAVAWLFGGIFFIEGFLLGGTYLNGKIENNQYFLGRGHGYYTQVSKECYETVEIFDKIFVVYCILSVLSIPIVKISVKRDGVIHAKYIIKL